MIEEFRLAVLLPVPVEPGKVGAFHDHGIAALEQSQGRYQRNEPARQPAHGLLEQGPDRLPGLRAVLRDMVLNELPGLRREVGHTVTHEFLAGFRFLAVPYRLPGPA